MADPGSTVDYQFAFFFRKTDSRHVVLLKVSLIP
jgi:hypothetical protein